MKITIEVDGKVYVSAPEKDAGSCENCQMKDCLTWRSVCSIHDIIFLEKKSP